MRQIVAQKSVKASLGKQGENNATQVMFPVLSGLTGALIVTRDGDDEPYPVITTIEDDYIVWTVNSYDTNVAGNVRAEVDYTDDDGTIVKSETYRFIVHHSLEEPSETVPDPYEDWYQAVLSAKTAAETAATAAATSASAAETSATDAASSAMAAAASAQSIEDILEYPTLAEAKTYLEVS